MISGDGDLKSMIKQKVKKLSHVSLGGPLVYLVMHACGPEMRPGIDRELPRTPVGLRELHPVAVGLLEVVADDLVRSVRLRREPVSERLVELGTLGLG